MEGVGGPGSGISVRSVRSVRSVEFLPGRVPRFSR